jgi:hypothetical protein
MQWQVANDDKVAGNVEYGLFNLRRRTLNLASQLGARWKDICSYTPATASRPSTSNSHRIESFVMRSLRGL